MEYELHKRGLDGLFDEQGNFAGLLGEAGELIPVSPPVEGYMGSATLSFIGQSVPQGAIVENGQKCFMAAPSQGIVEPYPDAPSAGGSYITPILEWLAARDRLRVFGVNGCKGGTSLPFDYCGVIYIGRAQLNNKAVRGKRVSQRLGDDGHSGELMQQDGWLWEATTGNLHLAFINDPTNPISVGPAGAKVAYRRDPTFIAKNDELKTAGAPPDFTAGGIVVGKTVNDGGIVWTAIAPSVLNADGDGVYVARKNGTGWDPYKLVARNIASTLATPSSTGRRLCAILHAQTDAGRNYTTNTVFKMAHRQIADAYFSNGIKTIHGGCFYFPGAGQAGYDMIESALSGGGIATPPQYRANIGGPAGTFSPLARELVQFNAYVQGIPGTVVGDFYVIPTLYRLLHAVQGLSMAGVLDDPMNDPHPKRRGVLLGASLLYRYIRAILLNVPLTGVKIDM